MIIATIASKLSAWAKFRKTVADLSALSDKDLADIGIKRGDIPAVARGEDPRW